MKEPMVRVRFTQDRVVDDYRRGTDREERYRKGQVRDLPESSARRWINRGIAQEVVAKAAGKAVKKAEVQKKAGGPEVEDKAGAANPSKAS